MHTFRPLHTRFAFTLIELITVIAIIAILMAVLFPAFAGAKESARREKARSVCLGIVQATKDYTLEYGKPPPVKEAEDGDTTNPILSFGDKEAGKCKSNNNILFDVLRAIARGENANHALNQRQKVYFTGQGKAVDPKNPRDGFCDGNEFQSDRQGQLMDPWGTQYCVVIERDDNLEIDISNFYSDLTGDNNKLRFSAVAWSMAKDGKLGGKGYEGNYQKPNSPNEAPDDVVTWR